MKRFCRVIDFSASGYMIYNADYLALCPITRAALFLESVKAGDVFMLSLIFLGQCSIQVVYVYIDSLMCTSQIADFGMSRDLADETYYISRGGKIPIKWTAPEVRKKYQTTPLY